MSKFSPEHYENLINNYRKGHNQTTATVGFSGNVEYVHSLEPDEAEARRLINEALREYPNNEVFQELYYRCAVVDVKTTYEKYTSYLEDKIYAFFKDIDLSDTNLRNLNIGVSDKKSFVNALKNDLKIEDVFSKIENFNSNLNEKEKEYKYISLSDADKDTLREFDTKFKAIHEVTAICDNKKSSYEKYVDLNIWHNSENIKGINFDRDGSGIGEKFFKKVKEILEEVFGADNYLKFKNQFTSFKSQGEITTEKAEKIIKDIDISPSPK